MIPLRRPRRPAPAPFTVRAARGALVGLAALLATACPGSTEVETEHFPNYTFRVARGDNETQLVGTPIPVTVHLTDPGSLQYPNVVGAYVTWTVSSGGGSVASGAFTTDQNGQASGVWTLGPQAGEQTLTVTVSEGSPNTLPGPGQSKTLTIRATALSNAVDRITVGPDATINVGATAPISFSLFNGQGTALSGRNVNVFSSNANVLRVDAGPGGVTATGLAAGTADVIVQSEGKEGRARITVTAPPVATIVLGPADTILVQGQTLQMRVTLRDAAGTALSGRVVTYESLDPLVASVSSTGLVTALAPGVAGIAARAEGREARVVLGVLPPPVAAIATLSLSPNPATVAVGATVPLTAVARDAQGNTLAGRTVSYGTSNAAVATVDGNGVVRGAAVGEAVITASAEGRTATTRVIVVGASPACAAGAVCTVTISTSGNRTSLQVGHTLLFQAILRDAAGNQITTPGLDVTYASDNATVAGFEAAPAGGPPGYFANIVGRAPGQMTLTVTAQGRSASLVITVTP